MVIDLKTIALDQTHPPKCLKVAVTTLMMVPAVIAKVAAAAMDAAETKATLVKDELERVEGRNK